MEVKIYKCFVASPGDTVEEREACDSVLSEINKTIGKSLSFRVESWKWENNARPGFGKGGQDVINKQLGEDYDLFIGIMYKKFGTATSKAGSGTEEEFDNAYQKLEKNRDSFDIMFYFNSQPVDINAIDLTELGKVRAFKKKIALLGGLYWDYNGINDFESKLRSHLQSYFLEKKSLTISLEDEKIKNNISISEIDSRHLHIKNVLSSRLESALISFAAQPLIWIDPIISKTKKISYDTEENFSNRVLLEDLIMNPENAFIKSPPQFGLTCLAHFLVKEAWNKGIFWLYVDSSAIKAHSIAKYIERQIAELGMNGMIPQCIVVDSWQYDGSESLKKIKNTASIFQSTPLIILNTIDDLSYKETEEEDSIDLGIEFKEFHLLALPRTHIRKIVSLYNNAKGIGQEDIILSKVINDLNTLNIHRTPLNCITLLRVAEKYFDESPVNRTKMLELVLFILFNMDGIPTYKSKPDLKDCEYVLGRYCEDMIRKNYYEFSRDNFINDLRSYCKEKLIELEVDTMFDVLEQNAIIIQRGINFSFRFSYWIFYFAAKQMHSEPAFAEYIFEDDRYASFPGIIEFYTGIDRNRADALKIITDDISKTYDNVKEKVGLPDRTNIFKLSKWNPTEEQVAKMQKEIGDDVISSRLPEEVKDRYADKAYNQTTPYNQSVVLIMQEYYLTSLINKVRAASRALRNSDYVNPDIKRTLLREIIKSWDLIGRVVLVLSPLLASQGHADYGGTTFVLIGKGTGVFEEDLHTLVYGNPEIIVNMFKDDLYSNKIGPLIYDRILNEENDISKHQLILLLSSERPTGWKKIVEDYIVSISKNSFYLADVVTVLSGQYQYAFADKATLNEISYLIKLGLAKHEFGDKKPGLDKIRKISNKNLPKRGISDADDDS